MSEENMSDGYEVGYRKPPKDTQSKKGSSGNPKGRPKKARDFDHELLRESRASITLNENGSRRRISKHEAAIKQLINKAISGNIPALRTYLDRYQIAFERIALLEASRSSDTRKYDDVKKLTNEELERMVADIRDRQEKRQRDTSRMPIDTSAGVLQ
jgi:hypothetical protein